jgi:putative copper export protein/methionine-rich copper-binding protein CopC
VWSVCERSASMVVMNVPLAGEPDAAASDRPVRPRSPRRPRRARIAALFVGVVVGLFGLFAFPAGAAQAHAALIRTSPAQGSIVTTAPSEIVITFSEVVQPVPTRITVIAPDGKRIDSGNPRVQGDDMHIPVRTNVPGGTYLVSYRVISADSHPVGGGFTYSVGAPSPGGAPKPVNGGETNKIVATGVSVMQFVGFVGLILVLGPAMVLIALWPRRLDRRQPIRIVYGGLGLIAIATIAGLYLQAPYDSGGSLTSVTGADLSDVFDSHFGQAYLVRLALLVVMGFLLRPVLAGKGTKTEHILLAVLGAVGVGTWALAGHPGASDVAPLTTVADVAHLASVGIWLGGLVMLAAFLLRRANVRELNAILPVWSNWAMLAITVLVLSGTAQALIEIGTVHALLHTTYGQLVIAKVLLLAVILAFAQGARLLVQRHAGLPAALLADAGADAGGTDEAAEEARAPVTVGALIGRDRGVDAGIRRDGAGQGGGAGSGDAGSTSGEGDDHGTGSDDEYDDAEFDQTDDDTDGDGDDDGDGDVEPAEVAPSRGLDAGILRRLRRSVLIEIAVAVAVLVATAILVQSSPGRAADANANLDAASQGLITLNSPIYSLQVDFSQSGNNTEIHLFASNLQGVPIKIDEWKVTATLPSQNLGPIPAGVTAITDSHAIGEINLTVPGRWTFEFTLRTSDVDEATVQTTVPIN